MSKPYPESVRQRARALYVPGVYGISRISRELGIPHATVRRWVNPDHAERQRTSARQRKIKYRGRCVDCGASTSYSGQGSQGSERCQRCRKRMEHDQRRWTRQAVIEAIHRFAAEHGRPPKTSDWNHRDRGDYPCVNAIARYGGWREAPFNTFRDAIEAAGFEKPPAPGRYVRTPETRARMSAAQRARHDRARSSSPDRRPGHQPTGDRQSALSS